MPQKIDPKEVLIYLNELGYTNISSQQLKEFIIDLKKIMKYEYKKRRVPEYNFNHPTNYNYSTPVYAEHEPKKLQNIFDNLHNQPTEASKAKVVNKREHQIAVHITQPKKKNIDHEHCIHIDDKQANLHIPNSQEILDNRVTQSSGVMSTENVQTQTDSTRICSESDPSQIKNLRPTSKQSLGSSSVPSSKFKKSKSAVLRNNSALKPLKKSDPVALYHQYQQEWKTIKFPGEDNHLDLRWAVREKLMDGPVVEKPVKKCSSKKKVF